MSIKGILWVVVGLLILGLLISAVDVWATFSDDHNIVISAHTVCSEQATITVTPDYGSVPFMQRLRVYRNGGLIFDDINRPTYSFTTTLSPVTIKAIISHENGWDAQEKEVVITIPDCGESTPNSPASVQPPHVIGGVAHPCLLDGSCPCFANIQTEACKASQATSSVAEPEEKEPFVIPDHPGYKNPSNKM